MALKIVSVPDRQTLVNLIKSEDTGVAIDVEDGEIETRVSRAKAEDKLLPAWKRILIQYEKDGGNVDSLFDSSQS